MSELTAAQLTASAIAAEKAKLADAERRVKELTQQSAQLQQQLQQAQEEAASLSRSVQWRELMAAVDRDELVYSVTDRITDTFAAFRESLIEPDSYVESQKAELEAGEEVVPYSDTDDYADFSNVEAAVEEALETARDALEANAASPLFRASARSSPAGSFAQGAQSLLKGGSAAAEPKAAAADKAAARRRALLQLLVLTVLMGKVEEHCAFGTIPDPSNAPRTDAEELRDAVASLWQWVFHEQPTVLAPAERTEWLDIVGTFLGEAYTAEP